MIHNLKRITEFNKMVIDNCCSPEKVAVDATCGNGHDTLYLAQHCLFVYGFDIQQQALDNTEALLRENGMENFLLHKSSFSRMDELVTEGADIITFNLGYLPGGDKSITTTSEETLKGLQAALRILRPQGVIALTVYWGHEEGKRERQALLDYCRQLNHLDYHVTYLSLLNQNSCPPEIIIINN